MAQTTTASEPSRGRKIDDSSGLDLGRTSLRLALGAGLGDLVGRIWIRATAGIPLWAILSAFLVPVGTGLLFGLYPALLAAHLSPTEALRHEKDNASHFTYRLEKVGSA